MNDPWWKKVLSATAALVLTSSLVLGIKASLLWLETESLTMLHMGGLLLVSGLAFLVSLWHPGRKD
ncbi:MAG: hypothetical protein WEA04_01440 [Candidatus Andersenbacteria bacterium]